MVVEYYLGTSGFRKIGQRDDHEAHGRGTNIRYASEAQRQYVAFPRRDAVGQRPVQMSGIIRRQADG